MCPSRRKDLVRSIEIYVLTVAVRAFIIDKGAQAIKFDQPARVIAKREETKRRSEAAAAVVEKGS